MCRVYDPFGSYLSIFGSFNALQSWLNHPFVSSGHRAMDFASCAMEVAWVVVQANRIKPGFVRKWRHPYVRGVLQIPFRRNTQQNLFSSRRLRQRGWHSRGKGAEILHPIAPGAGILYNIAMRPITLQDQLEISQHFPLESCLTPPDLTVPPEAARAFDHLFDAACAQGPAAQITYDLPYPKYLFLEYLAATRGLMLHGSNTRALEVLRPIRYTTDASEFGSQDAVYATQDVLWAMFFAVLDKTGMKGTTNGAIWLDHQDGTRLRRYYFALEANHLRGKPWLPGAMYLLPGGECEPDPMMQGVKVGPYTMQVTQWIYRGERAPLASLNIAPQDFPFLNQIWGYDLVTFDQRMSADSLAGFPFLEDAAVYPIIPAR